MASVHFQRLIIPRSVYEGMLWHALAASPLECCGLLAGGIGADGAGVVRLRYPLVNAAASPIEFESESKSLIGAHRDMRQQGLELLAVYHSHPSSPPVPSQKDRERNGWPEAVALIISLTSNPPTLRGWWLDTETPHEATWQIEG